MVLKRVDIRPNPSTGLASGVIFGHDEIICGGSYSSLWHVTAYSDSVSPILGDKDYLICSAAANGCTQPSGTWDLASAQPFTGTLPPPGFQAIFGNPVSDQTILQPTGTKLKIIGTLDLSQAVVIGFSGGSGGGTGAAITVNTTATAATVNFNDSAPLPIANATNIKWQLDAQNPTNVSAYIQWAMAGSSVPGLISMAGDLAGGTPQSPQVVSTHLTNPLPATQGGTGQNNLNAAFNAMAPAPLASQYLMVSTGPNTWGVLAPGVSGCLQISAGILQYLPCSTGTITGSLTTGRIPVATAAGVIGNSDLTQVAGTSITTGDAFSLQASTLATSLANQSSPLLNLTSNFWTGSASSQDSFSWQNVLGTGANPSATLTLTHTGTSGAAGVSTGSLGLGVGSGTVPGNCSIFAVSAGYCDAATVTNLDAEQLTITNAAARNFNVFSLLNLNLSANSVLNYFGQKVAFQTDATAVHGTGGLLGGMLITGANRGLAGSGSSFFDGLDIDIGQSSTAAGIGDMRGLNIKVLSGCVGVNCAAITNQYGIQILTGGNAFSSPIGSDYGIRILSPGSNASQGLISNHYAIEIDDQTPGAGQNANPWGIFEANANERNNFGAGIFNGALSGLGSVNFTGSTHTLIARSGLVASLPATCTFTTGAAMEVYLATNATAGQNWYFCTATNTWTQQLNSGTGSMATDASNASAVAVPNGVDWKPASAGGAALGTTAKPWSQVVFGNGSGTATLTGSFTGNRTVTIPDSSFTVAGINIANTFTQANVFAAITVSSITSATANSATGSFFNLANADAFVARNGTNTGNINVLSLDAVNNVYVGSTAAGVRINGILNTVSSGQSLTIQPTANTGTNPGGVLNLFGGNCASTGLCGDVNITAGTGGSGGTAIVQINSPLTFPLTNSGSNPPQLNKLVSYNALGLAVITPAGSTSFLAGVCAESCTTTGSAQIAKLGTISLNLDNAGTPGHYVGISAITNGFGTDCGATTCSTELVGVVRSAVSGTLYNVDVLIGSISSGGSSANAVVTNPGTNQVIQATSAAIIGLTVDCPVGAASNLACLRVRDNTGASQWEVHQDGTQQFGSGTGGTLTLTKVQSPLSPHATLGFVGLGDTDNGVCWRNHANGADVCFSKDINDVISLTTASLFFINPGRESLQETTAPTGATGQDMFYGDSTFHSIMDLDNNGTIRRLGHTWTLRPIAGTTDTVTATQQETWTTYSNGGAIAVAINQSTGQIANHFCFRGQATGAGAVTYTPTTSTINGGATFVVASGRAADICADGLGNYTATLFLNASGAGDMIKNSANVMGPSGTLNGTAMSVTAGFILPIGAGPATVAQGVMAFDSTALRVVMGDGTITIGLGKRTINSQSGTTYTMTSADCSRDTVFTSATSVAVTVPQASTSFPNGCEMKIKVDGVGSVTFTPTTSTIDGAASVSATTGQGFTMVPDGTNYKTFDRGSATGLNDCGSNGFLARTALNTTSCLTLTGTSGQINVTHGVGDGTPIWSLDTTHIALDTNALTLTNKVINASSNTISNITGAMLTNNTITSTQMAVVNTRRVCDLVVGDASGSVITNGQLGPQKRMCFIPYAATIVEVDVAADGGTPNVIIAKNTAGSVSNILSGALATAAAGGIACSNTGGTTGIDGATTCSATLQNTSVAAGAYLELVSGTAGGTAKLFTSHVVYVVQ